MGSNSSTQKAQLDTQNQLQTQQLAKQNALTDQVSGAVSPLLSGNVGYSPTQLAALNGSALDQNALQYNSATQGVNANLAARGESGLSPGSGVDAGAYGSLQAAKAGDLASSLRNVALNNANQAQSNRLNAASILGGTAQTYAGNVGTFGSGASNALSNYTQAQGNGFLSNFAKGLGSGLGSGASSALTGGLGTGLSKVGSGNFGW